MGERKPTNYVVSISDKELGGAKCGATFVVEFEPKEFVIIRISCFITEVCWYINIINSVYHNS